VPSNSGGARAPGVGDIWRLTWLGILLGALGVVFGFWTVLAYGHAVGAWFGFLIDMVQALVGGIRQAISDVQAR
jgi:hypothetical protein